MEMNKMVDSLTPILRAVKKGDSKQLKILLEETLTGEPACDSEDWKYQFTDLIQFDSEGRTALHAAAAIGNHESAYLCTQLLLTSQQVIFDHAEFGGYEKKLKYFIDLKDHQDETALHVAIKNKAAQVVTLLIEHNCGVSFRSKEGVPAMALIYGTVPEALTQIYDNSVEMNQDDFKSLLLDFGPIIGHHQRLRNSIRISTEEYEDGDPPNSIKIPEFQNLPPPEEGEGTGEREEGENIEFWKETENLSYLLKTDKWGPNLLQHPLLKIFLHLKWLKIQYFFWLSFIYHTIWFLVYTAAFVDLHSKFYINNETDSSSVSSNGMAEDEADPKIIFWLWPLLLLLAILTGAKEIFMFITLPSTYLSFENVTQWLLILASCTQFGLLLSRHFEEVALIFVVGILLSTILMICQLGKTPFFGLQVASLIKVMNTCKSHLSLFIVWFTGFGFAFWALFYRTEKNSILLMPAIVTAMATGELNLMDLTEKVTGESIPFKIISVVSLLFFIVVIVTLYLNLLIGYAISDIQVLKTRAEVLQLSNKLRTIYTVESFLFSKGSQAILKLIASIFGGGLGRKKNSRNFESPQTKFLDFTLIVPPNHQFDSRNPVKGGILPKQIRVPFDQIPEQILKPLKELAYNNLLKNDEDDDE